MAWTKASVDSGQHTYAEALTLMNRAGFSKDQLDEFLRFNPGDLYRVPEAFDLATGGVDPMSPGQVALPAIPPQSPGPSNASSSVPNIPMATSGGAASLFLTLDGSPVPSSSQPAREAAGLGGGGGGTLASIFGGGGGGDSATGGGTGIPWLLLIAVAVGGWFLLKGGRS
jgi:hypothetical protein